MCIYYFKHGDNYLYLSFNVMYSLYNLFIFIQMQHGGTLFRNRYYTCVRLSYFKEINKIYYSKGEKGGKENMNQLYYTDMNI